MNLLNILTLILQYNQTEFENSTVYHRNEKFSDLCDLQMKFIVNGAINGEKWADYSEYQICL